MDFSCDWQPQTTPAGVQASTVTVYLTILFTLFFGVGCAQKVDNSKVENLVARFSAPAEFQPLLETISHEAQVRGNAIAGLSHLEVRFAATLPNNLGAQCERLPYPMKNVIHVQETLWREKDPSTHLSVLFHEIGHCLLNQSHRPETAIMTDGSTQPKSLMNPVIVDGKIFDQFREAYLTEYFAAH